MAGEQAASIVITFNSNGGIFPTDMSEQTTKEVPFDGLTTLGSIVETPSKSGYIFKGWSTTSTGSVQYTQDSALTNSSITTFYAVWEALAPTITFNSTTGTFSDSTTSKSVQTNLDGTVSLSTLVEFPIKQSYVFRGWSTTENGSVVYTPYATPTITDDTTLYAVWQKAESYLVREDTLVNIANAVRAKTGGTDVIALGDMATMIAAIQSGALDAPKYIGTYKCYIDISTSYENIVFYDNINGRENAAIYSSTRYVPVAGGLGNAVIEAINDKYNGGPAWLLSNVTGDSQIRLNRESGGGN